MKVSLEWLKEFVPLDVAPEVVADRLTMIGFEVEGIERVEGDTVLELNVTPNRPDCLSILGVAREVAAAFGRPVHLRDLSFTAESGELHFNVDILEPQLCNRYAGRIIRGVQVGPSPAWMRSRLEKYGIRSINNIVDITNYVLLEFGHPLHAFDLNTLRGHVIRVGTPHVVTGQDAISFQTLDGTERQIPGSSLMIWDGERPIAIAGVMGGANTEVSGTTRDLFIESAYFDPPSIRRTSKVLGMNTESSYRFERGTDIRGLKKALDRAALLIRDIAGGVICGKIDIYPKRYYPYEIVVRYERVWGLIGIEIPREQILDLVGRLCLDITEVGTVAFTIKVPSFRRDLMREADIIEEIARHYGYDNIPSILPTAYIGGNADGETSALRRAREQIRQSLLKAGFSETINYSFMGLHELDLLAIPTGDARRNMLGIKNPLREEEAFMRTMLVPALLRNVVYNQAQGNGDLKLFEMARVFIAIAPDTLPEEREHFASIVYREKTKALFRDDTPDFYILKGFVEALMESLGVNGCVYIRSSEPFLHPGRSADVMVNGQKAGFFGVLSPGVFDGLSIKDRKSSVLALEFDIGMLMGAFKPKTIYRPQPRFPFVERDISIIVNEALDAATIIDVVRSYPCNLIEEIYLFDVFQGRSLGEGKKSIAFTVRYRSATRTLTDDEVDVIHKAVVEHLILKTDGTMRS